MSLPSGWVQQYDPHHKHHYWVDTKSDPPRAIWVHPYEDERFLAEQRAREQASNASNLDAPPSYDAATRERPHDGKKREEARSPARPEPDPSSAVAGPSTQRGHKRGVFERLRDKAIGTREEREEQRRVREEQRRAREEQRWIRAEQAAREAERARRVRLRELQEREEQARQERLRELQEREAYMRAYGGYAPYYPSYPGYGPAARQTTGLGGADTAALLLGGLAGGLLLGDILGGGLGF